MTNTDDPPDPVLIERLAAWAESDAPIEEINAGRVTTPRPEERVL